MKFKIESWLNKGGTNHAQDEALDYIFLNILEAIAVAKNETELRENLLTTKRYTTACNYSMIDLFDYGFGSNHMWVVQHFKNKEPKRLIFVEF